MDEISTNCNVIVMGDFNIWAEQNWNTDVTAVFNLMHAYGLEQLINEATHIKGHTLDHVYANTLQISISTQVLHENFGISPDHFPILVKIQEACGKKNQPK